MKISVLGTPGFGHEDWVAPIKDRYTLCHLTADEMIFDAMRKDTPAGFKAGKLLREGKEIPDELTAAILKAAAEKCPMGYVLTDMPKTVEQAKSFEAVGEKLHGVIQMDVPDEVCISRATGRRVHLASGRQYHVEQLPPKVEGKDDVTGDPLYHRSDDQPEAVKARIADFHARMGPIERFYAEKEKMSHVDGTGDMYTVKSAMFKVLDPIAMKLKLWCKMM